MRARYGSYRHRLAEAGVSISRQVIESRAQVPIMVEEQWGLTGRLYSTDGTSKGLDAVIKAFELAYSFGGRDLVLEHIDGTRSAHGLFNQNSLGGTRIAQPPQFSQAVRGEYVMYRTFAVAVKALMPVMGATDRFLDFSEKITISGGGWKTGCVEVSTGEGVQQRIRTHTTCIATQSGSATGFLFLPEPPPPIWPYALVHQYPNYGEQSPVRIGSNRDAAYTENAIDWSYEYQFTSRLWGSPHFSIG